MLGSIKISFFDIDGTLVNPKGTISPAVKESIKKLKDGGIILSLASGRPVFASEWIMEEIGINGPCMLSSGAVIYDPIKKEPIHEWDLDVEAAKQIVAEGKELGIYIELYATRSYFVEKRTSYTDIHLFYIRHQPEVESFDTVFKTQKVNRILFMGITQEEQKKIKMLREKYPKFTWGVGKGATHPDILFANATNPEGTRQWAFNHITGLLGLAPHEVMSFGDAESDKVFIQSAGVGVAMGDAPQHVKDVARAICGSAQEDGISVFLEEWLDK